MDQGDSHNIAHGKTLLVNFCGTVIRGPIQAESAMSGKPQKSSEVNQLVHEQFPEN
jgi:hypothetical protein